MLDDIIEVSGIPARWLSRTLPFLRCYVSALILGFALASLLLVVVLHASVSRYTKAARANSPDASDLRRKAKQRLLKTHKGHFWIAVVCMAHVVLVALVDAGICMALLGEDAARKPWSWDFVAQLMLFSLVLAVLFVSAFVVVPMLQMIGATYLLCRFVRKSGKELQDYIPEARLISTHVAQFWAIGCLLLMVYWTPNWHSTIRFVILEAAMGSATAWMDAAFAFNFCAGKIEDKNIDLSTHGVKEIVCMFGKTVEAVHGKEAEAGLLPKYEVVAQEESLVEVPPAYAK